MNLLNLFAIAETSVYLLLLMVATIAALVIPHLFRFPFDLLIDAADDLDGCAIAYLKGGRLAALQAAFTALWRRDLISLDLRTRRLTRVDATAPLNLSPLEASLLRALAGMSGRPQLEALRLPEVESIQYTLESRGLLLSAGRRMLIHLLRLLPLASLLLLGIFWCGIEISRHQPNPFLFLLLMATTVILLILLFRGLRRTWRGDRVLWSLERRYSALRYAARRSEPTSVADTTLGTALFGLGSVAAGHQVANFLEPPMQPLIDRSPPAPVAVEGCNAAPAPQADQGHHGHSHGGHHGGHHSDHGTTHTSCATTQPGHAAHSCSSGHSGHSCSSGGHSCSSSSSSCSSSSSSCGSSSGSSCGGGGSSCGGGGG